MKKEIVKKFALTDTSIWFQGVQLFQIRAMRNFSDVVSGQLGGFVECEKNLSQTGDCWIADNAKVFSKSHVCDDALVMGEAVVCGHARIYERAFVGSHAYIAGYNRVCGCSLIGGNALFYGNAILRNVRFYKRAWEYGK